MARKRTPEPPQAQPELRAQRNEATAKIYDRIARGRVLVTAPVNTVEDIDKLDNEYEKWNAYNDQLLRQLFTNDKIANEYEWAGPSPNVLLDPPSPGERLARIKEYIAGKVSCLESILERLELFTVAGVAPAPAAPTPKARSHTNQAFIVHGHDEAARETVARFLERLGVKPIILHEQATEGRTIVEKLERYSDVDFAVVLMTADDVGASQKKPDNLQPRARQNVILELGYFVGRLGRDKVCALYGAGVEMPSDYLGVGYVQLDAGGGWQLQLARELRAAGFAIDMNLL